MNIESYDGQDAFYTGTDEEYEEFLNSIRIVGTIELKRTVELSESDKKVNEEPFVIYISGNDEEGKILQQDEAMSTFYVSSTQ